MTNLTRRKMLGVMAAGAGGVAASSLMGTSALAQEMRIRHYWWGNPSRDERTFKVIELFQENHPGVEVSGETVGWSDYWTKLATQTAGGNMADLVQMDYRYLFEYARRGAIQPLDPYIGNTLDLSNFDQIWSLQSYLLSEADRAGVSIIAANDKEQATIQIMRTIIDGMTSQCTATPDEVFAHD